MLLSCNLDDCLSDTVRCLNNDFFVFSNITSVQVSMCLLISVVKYLLLPRYLPPYCNRLKYSGYMLCGLGIFNRMRSKLNRKMNYISWLLQMCLLLILLMHFVHFYYIITNHYRKLSIEKCVSINSHDICVCLCFFMCK